MQNRKLELQHLDILEGIRFSHMPNQNQEHSGCQNYNYLRFHVLHH
jgi:hypothetical protein